MINVIRDEMITALKEEMTSYYFYKRISEKINEYPAIVIDLRGDNLLERGTSEGRKIYDAINNFDIWCIHSEIQAYGVQNKNMDTAESSVIDDIAQIRNILLAKYGELIDFSSARYDEVYINGGHQFAGVISVKIGELVEYGE